LLSCGSTWTPRAGMKGGTTSFFTSIYAHATGVNDPAHVNVDKQRLQPGETAGCYGNPLECHGWSEQPRATGAVPELFRTNGRKNTERRSGPGTAPHCEPGAAERRSAPAAIDSPLASRANQRFARTMSWLRLSRPMLAWRAIPAGVIISYCSWSRVGGG
jgi:hypothetical protein